MAEEIPAFIAKRDPHGVWKRGRQKYDPRAYEDSPRKDCPWKCRPGDPKCLCEPTVTNGENK